MREKQFHRGGVEINFAEGPSSGPPLLTLHGGAGSWRSGSGLIQALSGQWHMYAPDFRGHGRSGHVPGRYHLRDYVADTAAFLHYVVAEPAVIYGHSLGGEVAIMVAAQHPELVRAVIDGDAPLSTEDHPSDPGTADRDVIHPDPAESDSPNRYGHRVGPGGHALG